MFISWGHENVVKNFFKPHHKGHCAKCEAEREFYPILRYTVHNILFFIRWVSGKSYYAICDICRRGDRLNTKEFEQTLGKSPIPAVDRLSGGIVLVLFAALIGAAFVFDGIHNVQEEVWLAQPQAGDIYEINLAKFLDKPETSSMYALMRVSAVENGEVVVQTPLTYSNKMGFTPSQIERAKTRPDTYFRNEGLRIPVVELKKLRRESAILNVER